MNRLTIDKMHFGEKLSLLLTKVRSESGTKQKDIAAILLISSKTISAWKKMKNGQLPGGANLIKLAEYFGVRPEYLEDDSQDWPPRKEPEHIAETKASYGKELPIVKKVIFKEDSIELLPDDPTGEPIIIRLKEGFGIEGLEIKPK